MESSSTKEKKFQTYHPVCDDKNCSKLPSSLSSLPCQCRLCSKCYKNANFCKPLLQCPVHGIIYKHKETDYDEDGSYESEETSPDEFDSCKDDVSKYSSEEVEQVIPCPLNCEQNITLKNLASHISNDCIHRYVDCQYCSDKICLSSKNNHEKYRCPMIPVSCDYCKEKFRKSEILKHYEMCDRKIVNCKYKILGCRYIDQRINIINHEKLENHSDLLLRVLHNNDVMIQYQTQFRKKIQQYIDNGLAKVKEDIEQMKTECTFQAENSLELTKNVSCRNKSNKSVQVDENLVIISRKAKQIRYLNHGRIIGKSSTFWSSITKNKLFFFIFFIILFLLYNYWI